ASTVSAQDLRDCSFGCTTNSFSIESVFLSATDVPGTPLTNTSCTPGTPQQVYMIAEISSNRNSDVYYGRIFADLMVGENLLFINEYLGTLPSSSSGITQRLVYGPFTWICGEQLTLENVMVVWRTGPNNGPEEGDPYSCSDYSQSQCQFPDDLLVSTPLAVQYDYTACTTGNTALVTFESTTIGGTPPYTYNWNFDGGTYVGGTDSSPIVSYDINGGPYNPSLSVVDINGNTNTYPYTETLIFPSELELNTTSTNPSCSANDGSGSFTGSGGTPPYSFTVDSNNTGASTSTNGTPPTILSYSGAGEGTITVTITDSAGCTATESIIVTAGDSTPPTASNPLPLTVECIDEVPAPDISVVTDEADNSGSTPTVAWVSDSSNNQTCPEIITRTYSVTDDCNNSINVTQTITVDDTTAPTINTAASNSNVECDGAGNTADLNAWLANNGGATATDNCSNVTWSNDYSALSDLCGATGSATVTFTATDECGNTSTTSATFTIEDNT